MKSPEIQVFFDNEEARLVAPLIKEKKIQRALVPFIKKKDIPQKVNVIFVDNPFIRKLNAEFRGIDKVTDVLSFNYGKEENQGEIYVSVQYLKERLNKLKVSLAYLIEYSIVHGMLHLAGYDHKTEEEEKKMRKVEEEILERLGD